MKQAIHTYLDEHFEEFEAYSKAIWNHPELGFEEKFAVETQTKFLTERGFDVRGVEGVPTALVAEYGAGKIKIGFLGEFDALPQLSQKICAVREPVKEGAPGHGCGHNLISTGALAAAVALKELVETEGLDCTVRYYGCPAEERVIGKVDMISAGVFEDLDFCLTWHPFDVNKVWESSALACMEAEFHFNGIAAHAAAAPHMGRSALDAAELMNVGANFLREHIIEKARIHYTIEDAGGRPNVVPAHAVSAYIVRAPKAPQMLDIFRRVVKIAQGAALMTETEMSYKVRSGIYNYNYNPTLAKVLEENFRQVEIPVPEGEEKKLMDDLGKTIPKEGKEGHLEACRVEPFDYDMKSTMDFFDPTGTSRDITPGSTDVGDVSYVLPTGQLMGASWAFGTEAHTWQAAAASGTTYAAKVAVMIGKVLANAAYDMYMNPEKIEAAKKELAESLGSVNYARIDRMKFD